MSAFIESPINIEKNSRIDKAWAIIVDGKARRGLSVYFNHLDTGHGFGCDVHHGVSSGRGKPVKKAFRVSHYKYFKGCPEKYLPLVKTMEKALRE